MVGQLNSFPVLADPISGSKIQEDMKRNEIDLRTDYQIAQDEKYQKMGEEFKKILYSEKCATPTRVFSYLAKKHNTTLLTIRRNLIRLGFYTPTTHDK